MTVTYLSPEECDRLIRATTTTRNRLLLRTLHETGLRISEALALTPESIDGTLKTITVRTLKRKGHIRHVPITGDLLSELLTHCADNGVGPASRLFRMSRQRAAQIVAQAGRLAGLDMHRCHPHIFRHSFGVRAAVAGVPVPVIQVWLGHANVTTTQVYMQVTAADTRDHYDRMMAGAETAPNPSVTACRNLP